MNIWRTANQIGLLFFLCSKTEREETENKKYRWKNFNGRRRNQAVTKQKKLISQQKQEERKKRETPLWERSSFWKYLYLKQGHYQRWILSANHISKYQRSCQSKNQKNYRKQRTNKKSKYRKPRGRNGNWGIVPCLQGRTYTL